MSPAERLTNRNETRVLLLPSTSRDAEAITKVLSGIDIECDVCLTLGELCAQLPQGVGTILIAEEALKQGYEQLAAFVAGQPVWSDLPIILLSRAGAEGPTFGSMVAALGNVSVVERPMRVTTLLSLVQASIRARTRQYQSRDHHAERERLLASERHARSESERASQIKDEFLATLSHELRTPLTAILGWSQILGMQGISAADITDGIKVIERNARAQTQIIEDLLDMSRIISGKIRLHPQPVNLTEIVRAAMDTLRPAAEAKNVQVELITETQVAKILGDPDRLQQIFWNLLSNAIKFTPPGGAIGVELSQNDAHAIASVRDSGEGIAADFLPFVFDRFRQANASSTRRHGGLGLGLAIVKQLVELHGGTIQVTSDGPGRGTRFRLQLPTRPASEPVETAADSTEAESPETHSTYVRDHSLSDVTVLLLDDEPDTRDLLQRLLEDKGARVLACSSAQQAYEVLEHTIPDVLVSDISMPHEDGYSFIGRVRQKSVEAGGQTPALALTAFARAEDRSNALRAGFQSHLTKPIEPAQLIATVASLARR